MDVTPQRRPAHRFARFSVWFLAVFLVLFPKGGVKIAFIPITWGYIYIALTTLPLALVRLLVLPITITRQTGMALLSLLPFQAMIVYQMAVKGTNSPDYAVSAFTGAFAMPWLFLLLYAPFYRFLDAVQVARMIRICMLIAALWGILLFFEHPFTGKYIEIPFLTVNLSDYGQLENTKHIARGFFFKLISTYNNGNLYGVCTLILYPFWLLVEPSRWRRLVLRAALVLTLSRTVWIGIIITELLLLAGPLLEQLRTFPRLYLGVASRRVAVLLATVALIMSALLFNSTKLSFLFDQNLGGRAAGLESLSHSPFLPETPLHSFQEIMYASAVEDLGYVGLLAFILWMWSPSLVLLTDTTALRSPFRMAAFRAIFLYAFLAGIDAAFNYIPTMAFYWFAWMVFLNGWPGGDLVPVEPGEGRQSLRLASPRQGQPSRILEGHVSRPSEATA